MVVNIISIVGCTLIDCPRKILDMQNVLSNIYPFSHNKGKEDDSIIKVH